MKFNKSLFVVSTLFVSAQVLAEEEKKPLEISASVGAIATSGNTDTISVVARLDILHDMKNWKTQYVADALFKEDEIENSEGVKEPQKTAEKYFLSAETGYKLYEDRSFLSGYASYTDDRFSGIVQNTTVTLGYGHNVFNNEKVVLKFEAAPGYTWNEDAEGVENESSIVRLLGDFNWNITENATFTQTLNVESEFEGNENVRTKSNTAISTKISDTFQIKFGVSVLNNSVVPEGFEKTDTETTVTLVYTL